MLSFRNVSDTMNRFLHKDPEHEVKVSTLEGRVESQGKALTTAYMEKAASILESHNIDAQSDKKKQKFIENTVIHIQKGELQYTITAIGMKFAAILWTGRMDKAIKYLNNIKKANIKNDNKLDELRGYLNRKSPYLTCYALRHQLGLRTSSNRVEKANDIVVANRQKHNGMAWSKTGSGALAIITVAKVNGELTNWIATGMVNFKLVA